MGGEDGVVESAVGVGEPFGASIVELGEGAIFEVGFGTVGRLSQFDR